MIDLNGNEFKGTTIFNGGNAGLAENVTISAIERKKVDDPGNYPDYKVIIKDPTGAEISQGFYYYTPSPDKSAQENAKRETQEVSRVLHIARAVMGADYQFPGVTTAKEAFDVLFKLIKENFTGKTFNVFVTYGTDFKPSKYLGLRYFDFIESSEGTSRLRTKPADNMERLVEDSDDTPVNEADSMEETPKNTNTPTTGVEDW